jgi:hypothetical protein
MEEIVNSMQKFKKGKVPGFDNVPAELLVNGGDSMNEIFLKIYQQIWQKGEWPQQWTMSVISPLPKNGNLRKCNI